MSGMVLTRISVEPLPPVGLGLNYAEAHTSREYGRRVITVSPTRGTQKEAGSDYTIPERFES